MNVPLCLVTSNLKNVTTNFDETLHVVEAYTTGFTHFFRTSFIHYHMISTQCRKISNRPSENAQNLVLKIVVN